jgi:hypothetical protein
MENENLTKSADLIIRESVPNSGSMVTAKKKQVAEETVSFFTQMPAGTH